ncbi:S8 family serine peptidase [Marinivivus vitaminiproducens]|uniref:S8 family serine peptidase n=1 Tax=Marinivivus vitaminiproducens TaxID=3035935 RepID=UPI00279FE8EC|nr:S8 family serine peptidase [Geminicoccaceae bacterium SCSIO 64248]
MRPAAGCLVLAAALGACATWPRPAASPQDFLRRASVDLCRQPDDPAAVVERNRPGAVEIERREEETSSGATRMEQRFRLGPGEELAVERVVDAGRLRRLSVSLGTADETGSVRPRFLALVLPDCTIPQGRELVYDGAGAATELVHLGPNLVPTDEREVLHPPIPPGHDPGGVTVALVDSGIAYTVPVIAKGLARDASGRALGYDYWDMDDRPYDLDTSRSPFFPRRHGTPVASILLREAPHVRLIPYRYPRPDLGRFAPLIADAEAKGARLVGMALGSESLEDWQVFRQAAAARPDMLFIVSAGNDGRNLDETPLYPASLDLPNLLVVTSGDRHGRLAEDANWGPRTVDLMVPGDQVDVIDEHGRQGRASGSSFAMPRVLALAARLAKRHPKWDAAEIKAAIRKLAQPVPAYDIAPVRWGWLPDPEERS